MNSNQRYMFRMQSFSIAVFTLVERHNIEIHYHLQTGEFKGMGGGSGNFPHDP